MAADRIRLTITVSPEAHAVFSRMAQAAGVSLGRAMGDWLNDTAEGAEFVAQKMEEARKAPMTVMREFRSMAVGMVDAVDVTMDEMRAGGPAGRRAAEPLPGGRATRHSLAAPSSNTGLKVPGKGSGKGQAKGQRS